MKKVVKIGLVALMAFTLSCSDDNDSDPAISSSGNEQSSSSSDCLPLNNDMAVEINLSSNPVVVAKNGSVLIEGVNYKVSSTPNSIKVNGIYDYIGSVERANSGSSGIVVKDGNKVLAENIDYVIIEAGNSVKIAGIGNYTGSVEVELPCETPAVPPTITTASLPSATVGTAYSITLSATGDTPIAWSIHSGDLPAGLSLSGDIISGTPTTTGTFNIAIRATNAGGYDEKSFSIVVHAEGLMYHGYSYNEELYGPDEELDMIIGNGMLKASEITTEGKTIIFNGKDGSGYRCILIPKTIGQITSLKDALNTENLGNPGEAGRTIFRKGQITYNGIDYYFYGGNSRSLDGLDTYITIIF